jgi:hypothetical protein
MASPRTWRELIIWLAERHHEGRLYAMARHLGRAPALLYQWRDGVTKQPGLASIDLIARVYGLDRAAVMDIALGRAPEAAPRPRRRKPTPKAGGSAAPMSDNGDYRPVARPPIGGIMSTRPEWALPRAA